MEGTDQRPYSPRGDIRKQMMMILCLFGHLKKSCRTTAILRVQSGP